MLLYLYRSFCLDGGWWWQAGFTSTSLRFCKRWDNLFLIPLFLTRIFDAIDRMMLAYVCVVWWIEFGLACLDGTSVHYCVATFFHSENEACFARWKWDEMTFLLLWPLSIPSWDLNVEYFERWLCGGHWYRRCHGEQPTSVGLEPSSDESTTKSPSSLPLACRPARTNFRLFYGYIDDEHDDFHCDRSQVAVILVSTWS